jgi:hypothetical protein
MYTTASGVPIPQGTDAFNPPTQFKEWGDKEATYENRVVVAVDSDRTALAAPVLRDGLECYVTGTGIVWQYRGTVWKPWESDWVAFTPTLSAASGGFVSASASMRYKWVAGGIQFWFTASMPSAGTAAGNLFATWPVPSLRDVNVVGSEIASTGWATQLRINGAGPAIIFKYDGSTIIATGRTVSISGYYEA